MAITQKCDQARDSHPCRVHLPTNSTSLRAGRKSANLKISKGEAGKCIQVEKLTDDEVTFGGLTAAEMSGRECTQASN